MFWGNPNPLVNPLNTRMYSKGSFVKNPNAEVPDSSPFDPSKIQSDDNLHTPNQIGLTDSVYGNRGSGLDGNRYFRCADGSILDLRTKRVVSHAELSKDPTEWHSGTVERKYSSEWNDREICSLPDSRYTNTGESQISDEDKRYWDIAEKESRKMIDNMNDEQKRLLASLEHGEITRNSRLVDLKPGET